ncbi:hypothetical protein [Pseudomonas sp. KNUC1026]|uniref:hypothetical protein n=1 Tax=Pseudomonas sp. KNUC1026 TaxID=2893890 RepID=UPI001F190AC7|nr:hypothetical protein [Pseudomonas sp. KNUC1026]UFH50384.1 hypothetical protein LN139_03745 [Pseudomonas sp. KNUC1026]
MNALRSFSRIALVGLAFAGQAAFAHGPVFDCYLEQSDQVKCEAGFTDGSSAAGRRIVVQDSSNKVLLEGTVGEDGTFSFKPPAGKYSVLFMGGDNHQATLQSVDITQ